VLLSLAGLLGLSACTDSAGPTSTSKPPESTSSIAPSSTTTPPTTDPVVTLPPGSVGDPAVIEAARTEALRLIEIDPSSFPPGAAEMEIPWPDTTNPDPVEALRSIWEFDEWVATTLPYDAFARMYLVEDSPAWRSAGEFIEQLWINGWIVVFDDPAGYEFLDGRIIPRDESIVPTDLSVGIPSDAVIVRYSSTRSSYEIQGSSDGFVDPRQGYEVRVIDTALARSDLGWRVFWFAEVQT
jgi:hypothetical protein